MRRRLLVVLLTFAAVAVTGFAWPLLTSTAEERTQRLLIDRAAALERFARLAQRSVTTGDEVTLAEETSAYAELYQESVLILDRRRHVLAAAGNITADDPRLRSLIEGALRNEPVPPLNPLRPWSRDEIVLTRSVGTGAHIDGVVVLRASVRVAAADVARSWLLVAGGALIAAAALVLIALALARWVLRPLAELADGVLALAEGRSGAHVPASGGPPELRALAASFNMMSEAVAAAADRQRQLVADASHQLRNPMAALRLRVDALEPSIPAPAAAGYQSLAREVERLESLLDGLLTLASADQEATAPRPADGASCQPGAVARDRLDAWGPSAVQAEIRLMNELPADLARVACADEELAQVLDVLLDNAIRYTGPGATVIVRAVTRPDRVRLIVDDDGPGLSAPQRERATARLWRAPQHSDRHGTGLGLAIAEQLLAARAGTLRILASDRGGLTAHVELLRADSPEVCR